MKINYSLVVSLAITTSLANATNDNGIYLGLDTGIATSPNVPKLNPNGIGASTIIDQSSMVGISITTGYKFNKNIAAEINYLYANNPASSYSIMFGSYNLNYKLSSTNQYLTTNIKGILPLNDSFSLFGKFGVGANFATINQSGNYSDSIGIVPIPSYNSTNLAFLLGVGVTWNMTEKLSLNLADNFYTNMAPAVSDIKSNPNSFSFGNTNFINLGVSYIF